MVVKAAAREIGMEAFGTSAAEREASHAEEEQKTRGRLRDGSEVGR